MQYIYFNHPRIMICDIGKCVFNTVFKNCGPRIYTEANAHEVLGVSIALFASKPVNCHKDAAYQCRPKLCSKCSS